MLASAPAAPGNQTLRTQQGSAPSLLTSGEKLYSPAALAKAISVPGHRGGAHLNGATIFRHITRGVRAANGEVIRLEAARCGSRWLSSVESYERFAARLTAACLPDTEPATEPSPTPKQQKNAAALASKKADAIFGGSKK
jgi:hypothetical protein